MAISFNGVELQGKTARVVGLTSGAAFGIIALVNLGSAFLPNGNGGCGTIGFLFFGLFSLALGGPELHRMWADARFAVASLNCLPTPLGGWRKLPSR